MTTATTAFTTLKALLTGSTSSGLTMLCWQNDDVTLPATPAAFAYTEFLTERAELASFGGGRGQNRWRNRASLTVYVFVPRGQGLAVATDLAEAVATIYRSYRDSNVSCFEASVYPGGDGAAIAPPGLRSEVNNYFYAVADISLFFDLIG